VGSSGVALQNVSLLSVQRDSEEIPLDRHPGISID
jgi:hypothetical protein